MYSYPNELRSIFSHLIIFNSLMQSKDVGSYQLWVKTDRESAPYPLIGHESPLAIKMNCLHSTLAVAGEDAFDFDFGRNIQVTCPVLKCYFILRSVRSGSYDLGKL